MADPTSLHLNLRVAWHDSRWNGHVCRAPSKNSFCIDLDRIRLERKDDREDELNRRPFWELEETDIPPCKADLGAFMNAEAWWRTFNHPYQNIKKAEATHGNSSQRRSRCRLTQPSRYRSTGCFGKTRKR